MVDKIKEAVGRLAGGSLGRWAEMYEAAVSGYRKRPKAVGVSPFELLYGVTPRLIVGEISGPDTSKDEREMEKDAIGGWVGGSRGYELPRSGAQWATKECEGHPVVRSG